MEKLIFIQDRFGYYRGIDEAMPISTFKLSLFLESEIGGDENDWKEMMISYRDSELFCNAMYVRKEGNRVFLGCFVDPDFDEYPDPSEYKTAVNEFLNMISAWFRLHKERPDKIILEVEGEKIRLYGED